MPLVKKRRSMHATQREAVILEAVTERGFISFQELDGLMLASPATIRRDLARMMNAGQLNRVRGGAKRADARPALDRAAWHPSPHLEGVPLDENMNRNTVQKAIIGKAAAKLCSAREAVMIDGGSTTLHMCKHLAGLDLQVFTNSLHIATALLRQRGTHVLVPAGQVFPEQNIILSFNEDDGMPLFHAPKLFMGAAALGNAGLMQADMLLVAAERRLIERADQVIVLLDSSKFDGPSGHLVCRLEEIDVIVTDTGIKSSQVASLEKAAIRVIVAQ